MATERRMLVLPQGPTQDTVGAPCCLTTTMLREPKSGNVQCCLMSDQKELLELSHFKSMWSAWLMDNELLADGGIYLATPLDPLFMLLPLLDAARTQGGAYASVFCQIDQIEEMLDGIGGTSLGTRALLSASQPHLACVCDIKEVDGDTFYRLNNDKALAWLLCKHDQSREVLTAGGQLSGLDEPAQNAYVASFLAEYLTPAWAARLAQHFGVELNMTSHKHQMTGSQPQEKRAKLDHKQSEQAAADRRSAQEAAFKEAANKKAAALRLQARQATVAQQLKGTKKISSFFAPKPQPP